MHMIEKQHSMFAFELITSSFYLWSHNRDSILIPHLKKSFTLTTKQLSLIDFAVCMAYFLMTLPAGYIMKKFGYKTGIIAGLMLQSFNGLAAALAPVIGARIKLERKLQLEQHWLSQLKNQE